MHAHQYMYLYRNSSCMHVFPHLCIFIYVYMLTCPINESIYPFICLMKTHLAVSICGSVYASMCIVAPRYVWFSLLRETASTFMVRWIQRPASSTPKLGSETKELRASSINSEQRDPNTTTHTAKPKQKQTNAKVSPQRGPGHQDVSNSSRDMPG